MRLLLKNVFKKPFVKGTCAYRADCPEQQTPNPAGVAVERENGRKKDDPGAGNRVCWFNEQEISLAKPGHVDGPSFAADPEEGEALKPLLADTGPTPEQAAQKLLEKKTAQGLREGYEQGRAKAEEECRAMREEAQLKMREAELTLRKAHQRSKEIVSSSENKIVELALAVAERLVRTRLEMAPETITAIVRSTMNMLHEGEHIELFVNPGDLEACLGYREQLKEEFHQVLKIEVIADDGIPRGSCRIESESGAAEYMLEEEKEQLKSTLMNIARRAEDHPPGEEEKQRYDRH